MNLGPLQALLLFLLAVLIPGNLAAATLDSSTPVASPPAHETLDRASPLFKEFCFKCHGDKKTKAHLNLERLSTAPDFPALFKTWEKVATMLEEKEMPPEDEPQPSEAQRRELVETVRAALGNFIRQQAGDPGRIAMRRLTSAEYAYSIQDLTGLDLGLERNFISDAVGGEGFSNVGDVQFVQDSTLEHYLKAAQIVASHAVIGAGPLHFYADPGKTGQELSAMARIQRIYQNHGFRTGSGEGGKAFGLDHYPKAFYAAWRFQHRKELGLPEGTLASFAKEEGLDTPFVEHIWQTLTASSASFPASEIAAAWKKFPAPTGSNETDQARVACDELSRVLQTWQTSFAENTGDAEATGLLTETSFRPSLTNAFRIRLSWPPGTSNATFRLTVTPAAGKVGVAITLVWSEPTIRFRRPLQGLGAGAGGRRQRGTPLRAVVSPSTAERLRFGADDRPIGTNDFVTKGAVELPIEFTIPAGMTQAELSMEARLDLANLSPTDDCIVRCVITHDLNAGATVAATGTFSILLANPNGTGIETLKAGVADFARNFPQISHREAAPADRDPIPAPFDNDYNNAERNEFHATLKYHRDDRFLTERILDSSSRRELDQAWTDLLTSFDYHDIFLRFVSRKYKTAKLEVATLTGEQVNQLPDAAKAVVRQLRDHYIAATKKLEAAEPGHVEDAVRFARLAWRRPLSNSEEERLRSFYSSMRVEMDHPAALRSLIARILVAPSFLYRIETRPETTSASASAAPGERVALSDWDLANRLSYFLWCSIPDAELSRAAAAGELKTPEHLAQQAQRMLRDPKARRFATEFFGQWFGFYRFDDYRGVDTSRFSEFTDELKAAMYNEAVSFFEHIVRQDRPVREILFADYTFLNPTLAQHYGIDVAAARTNNAQAISLVEGAGRFRRGGLLRLGAVLTSTSAPLRTSAVKRGDWILRRVLGRSIPPPPGDAGSIPPDDVLDDGKTVRQRLEAHRRDASCVGCHSRMDPLGFALEHFDSIGRWRDTYRDGQKIDASGKLHDGTEITEFEGLNEYLRVNETLFMRTLCAKLLGFALGRAELVSDGPLLNQMTAGLKNDDRFSTLVEQIVTSSQFRYRRGPGTMEQESKRVATLEGPR